MDLYQYMDWSSVVVTAVVVVTESIVHQALASVPPEIRICLKLDFSVRKPLFNSFQRHITSILGGNHLRWSYCERRDIVK